MPNLVHSLDACVVQNVIAAWEGVIGVVHDAFFTTVDKALELRECVRQQYANVHANLGAYPIKSNAAPLPVGLCIGL
jgi:DNA-directed RNA polymerase